MTNFGFFMIVNFIMAFQLDFGTQKKRPRRLYRWGGEDPTGSLTKPIMLNFITMDETGVATYADSSLEKSSTAKWVLFSSNGNSVSSTFSRMSLLKTPYSRRYCEFLFVLEDLKKRSAMINQCPLLCRVRSQHLYFVNLIKHFSVFQPVR